MEDIFKAIQELIPMQDAAKFYGLQINRSGMTCCPFHEDRTPSLKVNEDYFYCFGCGTSGDVTGFAAKLFNLPQMEAAKKISYDFGIRLFEQETAVPVRIQVSPEREYQAWMKSAHLAVVDYLKLLQKWRQVYHPKNPNEPHHPLFVESLQKSGHMEYLADVLAFGADKEQREMFEANREDIQRIQCRLEKLSAENRAVKRRAV